MKAWRNNMVAMRTETGRLPIFKIGNQWAGRKSSIARHFEKLESEKTAAA
jgi:hypothetical protein